MIAAGVAKARADVVHVAGADGRRELGELHGERLLAIDSPARHLTLGDRRHTVVDPCAVGVRIGVEDEVLGDVVRDVHAALAGHAQGSLLRRRQPVDVEDADDAVGELQHPVEEVLVLGVDAALGLGEDADRLGADEVPHDVEVVWREVHDHADVPDASRERPQAGRVHLEDASQLTIGQTPAQLADCGVEPLDVPNGEHPAGIASRLDHARRLFPGGGNGLLDEHVHTRGECGERHREVQAGGGDDADEVELLLGEHPRRVVEAARATALRRPFDRIGVGIGDGNQLHAGDGLVPDAHVIAPHHAEADDPGAQGAALRRRHPAAAPTSSGPSSAAVSLTAPMTVLTSSSESDGCTGMLTT